MKLGQEDVRRMVRLVAEVAALPGGHAEMKRYLMEGLCKLVDADAWVWGLSCQRDPDKPQIYVSFLKGGFSEETFVKFLEAVEHPEMIELASAFFIELKEKKSHLTKHRFQIADKAKFDRAQSALAVWKEADIGPTIMSVRPLDEQSSSTMGIYRRYGREEFTERESLIAHIILEEVPWLHLQGWPEDRGVAVPKLSRRERLTLNLLISGLSQKEIAGHMNISVHTVQGYIKSIYRYFGVTSQTALMNRFFQGAETKDLPRDSAG